MKIRIALFACFLTTFFFVVVLPMKKHPVNALQSGAEIEEEDEDHDADQEKSADYLKIRDRYEYDLMKDPVTGTIPAGIRERELAFARAIPERSAFRLNGQSGSSRELALNNYIPAGPNNIGGRTRAAQYDLRYNGTTNRVIISGCVSGGIMRSADGGNTWALVTPQDDIHNLTALVQDPRPGFQDTWYAGSGEFSGNTASESGAPYLGFGLWKSTNNGQTWTKLTVTIGNISAVNNYYAFDHPFDFVYNMAINPVNGDLYVSSWVLLLRSTDGGASFRATFQSATSANPETGQMHVAISNTGRVYLAVNGGANSADKRGVWYSQSGDLNSFTRIAGGSTLGVDSVAGWQGNDYNGNSKRILLALAPSNNNIAYVYYENGLSSDAPSLKPEADFFRLDVSGTNFTWSNRSANMPDFPGNDKSGIDPLTVQSGYDMELTVKPDNPDVVFIGGTNLYRSTDGFATTTNTSWIGGYATNFTYSQYANSHADIHRLVFSPSNTNQAICGNDGGVQETTNIMASTVSWSQLRNYQTLQCYNVAIDPNAGQNNFASGAQDNGVRFRDKTGVLGTPSADSNNHQLLFSADGAYVGISQTNSGVQYLYESIQFGRLYRARLNTSFNGGTEITPAGLTTSTSGQSTDENQFGEFVTNFRLESDASDAVYYVNFNRMFRTTSGSTVTSSTWTEMTGVSSTVNPANPTSGRTNSIRGIGLTRGPYTTAHVLYFGTTNGKIYRLNDPRNAAPTTIPVDITPAGLTGNVQDIAVNPNNDDEVLAVVSNYNAVSIWWTKNGRSATPTWKNAEGNLTLPSMRSCAIVVKKDAANQPVTEYYVGSSAGLYSTTNLGTVLDANGTPVWLREGGSVLNLAIVTSLAYRPVDNVLLVGTHGNGMFYTNIGTPNYTPNVNTGVVPVTNDRNFIKTVFPTVAAGNVQYQVGNLLGVTKIRVQVLNTAGQLVYREDRGYQNGTIPVQRFASGVYILNIMSDDNRYRHVQKLVKQ